MALVVLLGLLEVGLVEPVVAEDLLGVEPQGRAGVLLDEVAQRLEHVVELAQLALLVRQVEGHLVRVFEVGELAEDAVVDLHRLLLEQLGLGRDQGALLALGARLGLQVIDVAALLDVQLGQRGTAGRAGRGRCGSWR